MILFSVFNKDERQLIKRIADDNEQKSLEKKIHNIVKEAMTESINENGMGGLVRAIKTSYSMKNVPAEISHNGSELIVNLLEPQTVTFYHGIIGVLKNVLKHNSAEVSEAKKGLDYMRQSGIRVWEEQSLDDQILFKKAGVKKYTSLIDGEFVFTLNLEYTSLISEVKCTLNSEHKNPYSITSKEYDEIIAKEITYKKYASALVIMECYKAYYPEKKVELMKLEEKIQDIYYDSDEYNNSPMPF